MGKIFQYIIIRQTYLCSSSSFISFSPLPLMFLYRSAEMMLELITAPEALEEVTLIISMMDKPPTA